MELVVMGLILEAVDGLLPICCQNITVVAIEALANLKARQLLDYWSCHLLLVHIRPCPSVKLRGCEARLRCHL